jgi:hypothetical protein
MADKPLSRNEMRDLLAEAMKIAMKAGGGGFSGGGGGTGGGTGGGGNDSEYQSELRDLETQRVKNIKDYEVHIERVRSIQKDIKDDASQYSYYVDKLKKQVKQLEKTKKEIAVTSDKIKKLEEEVERATGQEKENLLEILKIEIARGKVLKEEAHALQDSNQQIAEALKNSNKLKGIWKSMGKDIDKIKEGVGKINRFFGVSKILDWEKAFRATQLSMGLSEQSTESMSKNITDAAMRTNSFGYTIKELAEMQGQFSDEIGRGTRLSEDTMVHMAAVAKATGLGTDGAAKFAGEMDKVGFGAAKTAKYIDQTMMDATSMGLNSTKVIKNLSSNLKLLNKYNFKGGAKGLAKMAENATKMGVELDMVAGMADKLFDIEGAVEMSAQLQVLGGEWSKLADPFKLMYMARNDMKGLQESIINATISTAEFNKESGEYEIQALELHRLKKVAEATGVDFDQLATSAKKAAQYAGIRKQIKYGFDEKTKEFIENTAYFNEKGEAEILINGDPKLVSQLTDTEKEFFRKEIEFKKDAAKRAKEARSLDEKYEDIKNTFATMFFPLIERFSKGSETIAKAITDFLNNETIKTGIWEAAKFIGKAAAKIGELMSKFTGPAVGMILALGGLWAAVKWIAVGRLMRAGFMSAGPIPTTGGGTSGTGGAAGAGMMKNLKVGGGLMAAGMAGQMATNAFTDPGSTANMWGNIGSSAASMAGMGMMVGGPWGAAIGGLLGAGMGYLNYVSSKPAEAPQQQQQVTGMNDGVVFNPRDKFMKVNDATMIAGTNVNGNKNLAKELMRMNTGVGNGSIPGSMNVSHGDLNAKVNGVIELRLNGASTSVNGSDILNNPMLIRDLTKEIQRQVYAAQVGSDKTKA